MRALLGLQLLEAASASARETALGPPLYHQQTTSKFQTGVNSISPSVVVIIIILAVIFFLSGCLHLLIRYIARTPRREAGISSDTVGILQGQLQQLFHLHDSGVDQAFIDTLPVFLYKSVKGLKDATDCAVCLCTFDGDDALRLLPKCSHAFHTDCIDTWLLSHSTCPLCRASLLPESNTTNSSNRLPNIHILPMAYVADHSEDEHRQHRHHHQPNAGDLEVGNQQQQQQPPLNACISSRGNISSESPKSDECLEGEDRDTVGKLMPVKLGKFTNTEARHGGLSCSNNMDPKRSYSMGSYEYVLDPSSLHVFITPTVYKKQTSTKTVPLTPGHRPNLSECILPEDIERSVQLQLSPNEEIVCQSKIIKALHYIKKPIKREESGGGSSFKVAESGSERWGSASSSKTWMRSSSEYAGGSSRRSCRFHNAVDATNNLGSSRRSVSFGDHQNNHHHQIAKPWVSSGRVSEMESCRSSSGEAEVEEAGPHPKTWEFEVEIVSQSNETSGSSASNDDGSESSGTSFARRTINWLVGRPKRIVHAAASSQPQQPTVIET